MSIIPKISRLLHFDKPLVPCATPFKKNGAINHSVIGPYASYLNKNGARGIYAHGTTGEGLSLTNDEKKKLTETWWNEIRSNYPDWLGIFNVSATCITETIDQASYYDQLGVDAIAVLPPIFYRPANDGQLMKYLKTVSDAAPSTPLIYYHFPSITHVNIRLKEFVAQAKEEVPRLVGMKYSSGDMLELTRFCATQESKSFKIFTGNEQTLTPMMALGVKSAICAIFNFEMPVRGYIKMKEKFPRNMDEVMKLQEELDEFGEKLRKGSFIYNIKKRLGELELPNQTGLKVGPPRMPIFE